MDKVGVTIMRELISPHSFQWNVRVPLSAIAKKAGVDEDTVRARLRRLNLQGPLRRWELVVNPSLLGMSGAWVEVKVGIHSSKEKLVSALKLMDGVIRVFDYQGDTVAAVMLCDSEKALNRRVQLISSMADSSPTWWGGPTFSCELELSRTDWQIIRSLRKDPRKRYSLVARELGISTRTVRRRVKRMSEGKAFFLDPVLDLSRGRGTISCDIRVSYIGGANTMALHEVLLSKLDKVIWANGGSSLSQFVVAVDNAAEIGSLVRSIRAVKGVKEVKADIQANRFAVDDWFDEQIERKFSES